MNKCQLFALLTCFAANGSVQAQCPQNSDATPRGPIALNNSGEFVPAWAKDVVWYQIFPERFRDGDPSNNPKVSDIVGADPAAPPKAWNIHPWGSDWYKLQPYELENGEKALWMHMLRRRYGGDLQGVIDKLDYLKELGISAIYLNPVFDAPSLHKYDGASYHHIDPNFGPDPEGDRALMATEQAWDPSTWVWTKADKLALKLIEQAHQRGIRIIFDGVFNHMGINSFAFVDLKKNQQESPYKDWFNVVSWDDPKKGTEFDYLGWFGVKSLPEFRETDEDLAPGPKAYIFAATERWMKPQGSGFSQGIDGWRLDVAFCVGHGFWKDWRAHVKRLNPEAYLTAEIVDHPDKVKPYLQGDEFDGEMNYNFAFTAAEFLFNPPHMAISASEFDSKLKEMRELYPKGVAYVTQNLFGSHDSNRIGSHIVNRGIGNFRDWGKYFNLSQVGNNPDYQVRKPNAEELQLQKLFVILQMTYVGAPMVYYGDEVGMWGANDPDDRKPMIWPDIRYENEVTNPDGSKRSADKVAVNQDLLAHYRKLIDIRNQYVALRQGDFQTILVDDERGLYGYERQYQGQRVWIVLNRGSQSQQILLENSDRQHWLELVSNLPTKQQGDQLQITLPAYWGAVMIAKPH
ncbi:glycoside hydrolase family 13 protein [Bowmanella pacifica]|uniref:Alpha-amylase n=1 Tax=Bowmanella pacifica TaxID=502051 RepID=A0A917YRN1_9ALTE|nr:glycoside hydrolase family 13 protein [Bowmanella pacifica]GGO64030.1 alpha-amylase [Bowmanella pacifica]